MPRTYGITNAAPWAAPPAVGPAGDTYYNTLAKTLYLSDGTRWNAMGAASPGSNYWMGRITYNTAIAVGATGLLPVDPAYISSGFTRTGAGWVQCQVAGVYSATALLTASFGANVSGGPLWCAITHQLANGTDLVTWDNIQSGPAPTGAGGYTQAIASGVFNMAVGDTLRVTSNTPIAATVLAQSSFTISQVSGLAGPPGPPGPDVTLTQSSYAYLAAAAPTSFPVTTYTLVQFAAAAPPATFINGFTVGGPSNTQIAASQAGRYRVQFEATLAPTAVSYGTTVRLTQYNSGGTQIASHDFFGAGVSTANYYSGATHEAQFNMAVGDYISVFLNANNAAATLTPASTTISITPVGGTKGDPGPQGPDVTLVQSSYFFGLNTLSTGIASLAFGQLTWSSVMANNMSLGAGTGLANGAIVFAQTGKYLAKVSLGLSASATNVGTVIRFNHYGSTGTLKFQRDTFGNAVQNGQFSAADGSIMIDAVAGDYFQVYAQPNGATLTVDASRSWIEVIPVGGTQGPVGPTGPPGGWGTAPLTISDYNSAQAFVPGLYTVSSSPSNGPPTPPGAPTTPAWHLSVWTNNAGDVLQEATNFDGASKWVRTVYGGTVSGAGTWRPVSNVAVSGITDCNQAIAQGTYAVPANAANRPTVATAEAGVIETDNPAGYSTTQPLVQTWTGMVSGNQFVRKYNASAWSAWQWITPSAGVLAYKFGANSGLVLTTTPTLLLSLNNVPMKVGRLYRMTCFFRALTTTAGNNIRFQYTSGTTAGYTSNFDSYTLTQGVSYGQVHLAALATVTADGNYSIGVQGTASAASAATIWTEIGGYMMVEDLGMAQGAQ